MGKKFSKEPFKNLASSRWFKSREEFLDSKGVGKNKGTKYAITIDRVKADLESDPERIVVDYKDYFSDKNKYFINKSVKNSVYASPNFQHEIIRALALEGKYQLDNESVISGNTKKDMGDGETSGDFHIELVKVGSNKIGKLSKSSIGNFSDINANKGNKFLIANIGWNPSEWRNTYINPKGGHSYTKNLPGHESLNFKFDKEGIDTDEFIYGYFQWTHKPVSYEKGGVILFFSQNAVEGKGQIVGIYSNAEILEKNKKINWAEFENNLLVLNIKADKDLSMLFPIPLDADVYKKDGSKRLVGQIGYSYYELELAERIVKDELVELAKSGLQKNEFEKLKKIYTFVSGKEFDLDLIDPDEAEQQELVGVFEKEKNKSKVINDLLNLKETEPETVLVNQKTYKRDNKTIAQLKIYREFKCQICDTRIKKKNGGFYIEAAHIKPKHKKGSELPSNILILCPNHHKEFDYGNTVVVNHSSDEIEFELNGKVHKIDLLIR